MMNLSVGGGPQKPLDDAINAAVATGVVAVVSAGKGILQF